MVWLPTIALFKFVGSRQILSLRFLDLSFDSTKTKLFIHGVALVTGFNTPACNILSISFLNASFKWHWLARCLFWLDAKVKMDGVRKTQKLANTTEDIWVLFHNLVFACNYLVWLRLLHCWCLWGILHIGCCACFCYSLALSGQLLGTMYLCWYLDLLSLLWMILCVCD